MPTLLLSPWFWLAIALAAAGAATRGWVAEHDAFVGYQAAQEALGKEAERRTEARIKQDKDNKEQTDAAYTKLKSERDIALGRVRKPATDLVPPAPVDSSRPDLICYDRVLYVAADGKFTAGARGLADEGTTNATILDVTQGWANRLSQTLTK